MDAVLGFPGEIWVLAVTAASIAVMHTLLGPDHYLPFIVIGRARQWSLRRTLLLTVACGVAHVGSSVALGAVGLALGAGVAALEPLEDQRGTWASWGLLVFGVLYLAWGLRRAVAGRPHAHHHDHHDGHAHQHDHHHLAAEHMHPHAEGSNLTPWVLFIIFVLGPCEPLIPVLMYPAATHSLAGLGLVTGIFLVVTLVTMVSVVAVAASGLQRLPMGPLERFSHALAGGALSLAGAGMVFLGL